MPALTALEMLVAVHQGGSLSAAGKQLGLSQQAVSSRMRSLESQIGADLLARTPRGTTLTEKGTLIAGWAEQILAAAERLDRGIASIRSEGVRELKVAASQTMAEHLVPRWLVVLRREQESLGIIPTVVELKVANSQDTVSLVRSGQVDLGFVESPQLPSDLKTAAVGADDLLLVVAPRHPWARRRRPVTVSELAATALVAREQGSGTRDALEFLLRQAGATTLRDPIVELSTAAAVRSSIAAGTAPGVLSALAVRDDLALHRLVEVKVEGLLLRRPLNVIWRTGNIPPQGPARDLAAIAARAVPGSGVEAQACD
ncbi:LysR family transcriptional regulator [Paeniglutamicibacter cryotolerans]|uniref:DNA-binding transcriptional LysR family regulator n=1 Tax=Paeniglutamicibacter cryotolerans TaxID=670079 RepID=A0A839QM03_9MICC|nr:LysR family transcriptional regulator [Paeniglutamicibacter cryotolerans]MBB2995635.1 DNA-binding transcriptional LysR family regulator [Paeniglutamicibacter cryotolerans]